MRIALTGTPGCGKTTLAALLADRGHQVIHLADWARKHDAVAGHDAEDDADAIDVDTLAQVPLPPDCVVDGHLSHLLGVDVVWLIRCDPALLRPRLEARGYGPGKVQENWEAECMDLVLQEALDGGAPVVQRDGSRRSPEELLSSFEATSSGGSLKQDLEPVDWSHRLME